jgi:hypothetical protein
VQQDVGTYHPSVEILKKMENMVSFWRIDSAVCQLSVVGIDSRNWKNIAHDYSVGSGSRIGNATAASAADIKTVVMPRKSSPKIAILLYYACRAENFSIH